MRTTATNLPGHAAALEEEDGCQLHNCFTDNAKKEIPAQTRFC